MANPADVPTSQKETLGKTDSVDSRKLARSLRGGELTGIHVPNVNTLEARTLLRARDSIVKDLCRMKQRVKGLLYFYGIHLPPQFQNSNTHWSRVFMHWLRKDVRMNTEEGMEGLRLQLDSVESQRTLLLDATRKLRKLARSERYRENDELLRSVPGIGMITSLSLLVEIEDVSRFPNTDRLAGYIGLVPTSHSSGEKDNKGEMTFRGRMKLRNKIIESVWIAARIDPALSMAFYGLTKRMQPNKANSAIFCSNS